MITKIVSLPHVTGSNTEISAVCTHPEFRGRGCARDLTTFLAAQILAAGKTRFLHVKSENGTKVFYQEIGFRLRATIPPNRDLPPLNAKKSARP